MSIEIKFNLKTTINQRIREVEFFAKKNGVSSFPKYIGITPGNYGNVVGKRQSAPSIELIGAIMKTYQNLNPHWLINGIGKMWIDEEDVINDSRADKMQAQIDEIIKELQGLKNQ